MQENVCANAIPEIYKDLQEYTVLRLSVIVLFIIQRLGWINKHNLL